MTQLVKKLSTYYHPKLIGDSPKRTIQDQKKGKKAKIRDKKWLKADYKKGKKSEIEEQTFEAKGRG